MIEPYIETVSGKKFYFNDPKPEMIDIQDIAHALSMNCRYTGHCSRFYSVAEHSVLVAQLLRGTGLELHGLLHDASEAYITDIASPIKQFLPDYINMEDKLQGAIFAKWGLHYPMHPAVKYCDFVQLSTEAHYLLPSKGNTWDYWKIQKRPRIEDGIKPMGLDPTTAKNLFLETYDYLMKVNELRTNRAIETN